MENVRKYYPVKGRVILHVDMNAFYCSVHAAEQPELYAGKATAVAGSSEKRKGVIVTCSYEARKQGIKTGMVVNQALRKCPDLIVISPDFHLYRKYSKAFMKIAYEYTPDLEATSIDECYLDITGSKQFGTPLQIAEEIQKRINDELGIPCSVGIAPNKLLAKMGSDMKKPNGITVLRLRDVQKVLWNKPCAELFGIGQKTADKLRKLNIHTIGQLAKADEHMLKEYFGVLGIWMKQSANGISHSPVVANREPNKSIGHTITLPEDISSELDINRVLLNISDQVGRRLRKHEMMAGGIQITIRSPDMKTITRSQVLQAPTDYDKDIYREALNVFYKQYGAGKPLRMLGITLHSLVPKSESAVQLDLFDYQEQPKKESLIQVMDALRDKFGENAVLTAGMLGDDPSTLIRNDKVRGTSLQKDNLPKLD